jgi:hypothetical protein
MRHVAALYVHRDSIYKSMPGVECWDEDRDAMTYRHVMPIVAHPPCRLWASLRHQSTADPVERLCATHAIGILFRCGGVLEHPKASMIWPYVEEGRHDGNTWMTEIRMFDWGFPAIKRTILAVHGCPPCDWPDMPLRLEQCFHRIGGARRNKRGKLPPSIQYGRSSHKRAETPLLLAEWMVEVARRCVP